MPRLSNERYAKVISDYESGLTQKEVGELNGIKRGAVHNILVRFGVAIREYTGERNSNRRWEWDFNFFYRRNPSVAYWAGLLMADGNIKSAGENSYTVCLCLHKKDKELSKLFCRDVGLDWKSVHIRSKDGSSDIRLNHLSLLDQLEPWGIIPRKTYTFIEPQVSLELLPHYLRGWADGDGHIYRYGNVARFSVTGNPDAMIWYQQALHTLGYAGNSHIQKRADTYSVVYVGGELQVDEIANLLLVDTTELQLDRKWHSSYTGTHTMIEIVCEYCGKIKSIRKSNYTKRGARFCSRRCSSLWQAENKKY